MGGGGHLPPNLAYAASGCVAEQQENITNDMNDDAKSEVEARNEVVEWRNKRITSYYIWMPYVLILCAALSKLPRFIWKTMGERGVTESVMQLRNDSVKMGERTVKLLDDIYRSKFFVLSFTFCEFLNIVTLIINFSILDKLLGGQFWSYGSKVIEHMIDEKESNPMCTVFPTEVSCDVSYGASTGDTDNDNIICILSNNAFNQYYFFVLDLVDCSPRCLYSHLHLLSDQALCSSSLNSELQESSFPAWCGLHQSAQWPQPL